MNKQVSPLILNHFFFSNLKVFLLEQTREDIYPTPTGSLTNCSLCSLVPSFSLLHIKETTALKPLMIIFECDPRHKPVLEPETECLPCKPSPSQSLSAGRVTPSTFLCCFEREVRQLWTVRICNYTSFHTMWLISASLARDYGKG